MAAGTTSLAFVPQRGWFWHVPLTHDMMSVGVVAKRDCFFAGTSDLTEIYWRDV